MNRCATGAPDAFLPRDNLAIGRDVVLTSDAAAQVLAACGNHFPVLPDPLLPTAVLRGGRRRSGRHAVRPGTAAAARRTVRCGRLPRRSLCSDRRTGPTVQRPLPGVGGRSRGTSRLPPAGRPSLPRDHFRPGRQLYCAHGRVAAIRHVPSRRLRSGPSRAGAGHDNRTGGQPTGVFARQHPACHLRHESLRGPAKIPSSGVFTSTGIWHRQCYAPSSRAPGLAAGRSGGP